jgi:AcrR family transcriptional regulator
MSPRAPSQGRSSHASTARGPGRPRTTTAAAIAEQALRIADEQGLDALTMPRLAEALGIGTMTLYGYFRSKDELLDAVVDAAVQPRAAAPRDGSWQEQLRAIVSGVHDALERHPALVEIRLRRPVLRPEALRFGERCMQLLLAAGLSPDDAAAAFRLLFTYVFGFAALSPSRDRAASRTATAAAVRRLPADRFPALTTHGAAFSEAIAGQRPFDYGLDRIIDGLQQAAGSAPVRRGSASARPRRRSRP